MERLAIHFDKKAALRAQMINAMIYPAVVVLAAIGVGTFMVVKIIPKFAQFLLGQGKALPPSTQMLIDISAVVRANGLLIVGGLIAFITRALSILLRSGATVYDAMKITASLIGNRVYADKLQAASVKILEGREISRSLSHPKIPPLVVQMIAVGESTGNLDHVLQELGVYYEKLLEIAIKRLSALIEPAMILVIGSMVGFVDYAFFQALFSLVSGGR